MMLIPSLIRSTLIVNNQNSNTSLWGEHNLSVILALLRELLRSFLCRLLTPTCAKLIATLFQRDISHIHPPFSSSCFAPPAPPCILLSFPSLFTAHSFLPLTLLPFLHHQYRLVVLYCLHDKIVLFECLCSEYLTCVQAGFFH